MASNLSTFDVLLVTICMSAGINLLLMIVAALSSPGSSFSFIYWILLTGTTICGFFLYLYMTMTKKRLVIFTSAALYICGVHGYYLYYLLSRPCPRKVGCSPFNTMAFFFGVMLLAATFPVMAIMLVVSWLQVWEGQPISPRTSADLEKQPKSVLKRPTTPALDGSVDSDNRNTAYCRDDGSMNCCSCTISFGNHAEHAGKSEDRIQETMDSRALAVVCQHVPRNPPPVY